MDGTFTSNPEIFAQLYTIQYVKVNNEFTPQCWCLLPDKQAVTYTRLFQQMTQQATSVNLQLKPTCVHIDFKLAVVQAVRNEFGIEPSSCLFHFSQSILRHFQQCGLQAEYNNNTVRTWIRRLIALPLLPQIRIDQAFAAIVAAAPNIQGSNAMNNFVNDTYINPAGALFSTNVWNCYGCIDRTTNACEGYHSVIISYFRQRHPDPYKFIRFLQEQEAEIERRLAQLQQGAPARKRKTKYVLVDEALNHLSNQYFAAGSPNVARLFQYMDAVAHQLYDVKH
jgi:hypothetical protein